jgi:hypothetical protein
MKQPGNNKSSYQKQYQPFPELPPMTLRLFGVHYEHHLPPGRVGAEGWNEHRRYTQFRRGIAQILRFEGVDWRMQAGIVACRILRPDPASELFEWQEGQGLTYRGLVEDTERTRYESRRIRASETRMYMMDVLFAVREGDQAEAWEALHGQVGSDS